MTRLIDMKMKPNPYVPFRAKLKKFLHKYELPLWLLAITALPIMFLIATYFSCMGCR